MFDRVAESVSRDPDKRLAYIGSEVQRNTNRDNVPEDDPLSAPFADSGAADSEAHSELVLRDPLFIEYSLSDLLTIILANQGISSQKASILLRRSLPSPTRI